MKKTTFLILFLAFYCIQKSSAQRVSPLILTGTWTNEDTLKLTGEKWISVDSTELQGYGFKIAHGKEHITEKLMLKKMEGHWLYIAQTGKQNPIAFTLKPQTDAKTLTFINVEHDFPQVIEYTFKNETTCTVVISDVKKKKSYAFNFYKRVD